MKTLVILTASLLVLASTARAQSYGTIYPKGQGISLTGAHSGLAGSLWENALGDSWNYPTWAYGYGVIKAGTGDSQSLVSVTNRNFVAAVTPSNQLGNFMNGAAYSSYVTHNIGFNLSARYSGYNFNTVTLANNTTVGYGVRTSKWSGHVSSDAGTSFMTFFCSNWGYQPGYNPAYNKGAYSATAWVRAGWLGAWGLNQGSLNMGKGVTRRWTIGQFTTAIDSHGNCPYRYIFTNAQSLTASTASDIFIIPSSDQQKFLNGSSFTSYGKLSSVNSGGDEIVLPAGRTYYIAVRDGVNTTSCEGAQVLVYGQYYR